MALKYILVILGILLLINFLLLKFSCQKNNGIMTKEYKVNELKKFNNEKQTSFNPNSFNSK